jgi:hypothetical protein
MYLVISTIPHFFSILPLIKYYNKYTFGYINIIILSTTLSILYHTYDESNKIINFFDYCCAGVWFLYDLHMGYKYTNGLCENQKMLSHNNTNKKILYKIILSNSISFFLNNQITHNTYYQLNHSLWHLINAYKCFYVSNIINRTIGSIYSDH